MDLAQCPSIFPEVIVYPFITVLEKNSKSQIPVKKCFIAIAKTDTSYKITKVPLGLVKDNKDYSTYLIKKEDLATPPKYEFNIQKSELRQILEHMRKAGISFKELCDSRQGIIAGDVEKFIFSINTINKVPKNERNKYKPLLIGGDIERYYIPKFSRFIFYDPNLLTAPRNPKIFECKKIVMQDMSNKMEASIDKNFYYCLDTTTLAFMRSHIKKMKLEYILTIMNSKLINFFMKTKFKGAQIRGGYLRFRPQFIDRIPIRSINFDTPKKEKEKLVIELKRKIQRYEFNKIFEDINKFLPKVIKGDLIEEKVKLDIIHEILVYLAEKMIEYNKEKYKENKSFLNWLEQEIGVEVNVLLGKTIIKNYHKNSLDELIKQLNKNRKKLQIDPSNRNFQQKLLVEFNKSVNKANMIQEKIRKTDYLIDQIVYRLYGLSEEEIKIVEKE